MLPLALKLVLALLADRLFGELRRFHPLVGFGHWAERLEALTRRQLPDVRVAGLVAWILAVAPIVLFATWIRDVHPSAHWVVDVGLLYLALGTRSLIEHAEAIAQPLQAGDLETARTQVARIVSRDTGELDAEGIARAATESVLENGNDASFGTLLWFCLLGGPGALLFRLANTLDAMWGYRTPRYLQFGWAAARIDDVLNWLPARLCALTYAVLGNTRNAWSCWRTQAAAWSSPNAGPVMAAGAGALGVELGGTASYRGETETRPRLGRGRRADAAAIHGAIALVRRGLWLWLAVVLLVALPEALQALSGKA